MNKVHIIPSNSKSSTCASLGSYLGKAFIAYGCGKKVCIIQANTLFLHQLTEEQKSDISHVAFARTGGRLAVGMNGLVQILTPVELEWKVLLQIEITSAVSKLSWSFFGDALFVAGAKCSLWRVSHNHETENIWSLDKCTEEAALSPDGRLVAIVEENKVLVYYKDTEFSFIKLSHQAKVNYVIWKDIKTVKLYMNCYNPNALLVVTADGWIKVWSEYYSPTGIGFNIIFQLSTKAGVATWLQNFLSLENQLSALSKKKQQMRDLNIPFNFNLFSDSCLFRSEKSQPEYLMYGAMMKEKIPMEWLILIETDKIVFYSCEGLGSYPVTAINIRLALEIPSTEPMWLPSFLPVYVLKEWDEIQVLGFNKDLDLVRWRKKFEKANEGDFELTAVRGGHNADILDIVCHNTLPLILTIDSNGKCRVWSCTRGMSKDKKTVQHLMHWGVIDGKIIKARWLDGYAIMLIARGESAEIVKWNSQTLVELKLPSMKWKDIFTWQTACKNIEISKPDIRGSELTLNAICFGDFELTVWKVKYCKKFEVELVGRINEGYLDGKIYSKLSHSDCWKNYFYVVGNNKIEARELNESLHVIWKVDVRNPVEIVVSSLIAIVTKEQTLFYTHDGTEIGKFEDVYGKKLIAFTQRDVECFGIISRNTLSVMAKKPPKIVGEAELVWDQLFSLNFQEPITNCVLNSFDQFITSTKAELQVFTFPENSKSLQTFTAFSDVKPVFHPLFLLELLRTQQDNIVKLILTNLYNQSESMSFTLNMTLQEFINPGGSVLSESMVLGLKSIINEKCLELPGFNGEVQLIGQLIGIVDIVSVMDAQIRSLDEFAKVFVLDVKMFKYANEQKIPASLKPSCLSSMEIAWALHSDQQDTFFSLFFSSLPDWNTIKMYGIGIWLKNPLKLKKMIEELALNEFRRSKEPKNVALWYMALGKKTILTELFKKDGDGVKIYNFMKNDFNNPEWKVKAQKNAFELRRQGKFELSAAFFILGGDTLAAVEILAENLFDPQLAFVIARLKEGEGSEIYKKVVNDYFLSVGLKEKDPWLTSIAHYLLKNYAESITSLEKLKDPEGIVPKCWNKSTSPSLSDYHPCLKRYIELVKNTIAVKRDCEDRGISISNLDSIDKDLANRSATAYLKCGLPILSLIELLKDPSDYELIDKAVKKYLMIVCQNCKDIKNDGSFGLLQAEVIFCSEKFGIPVRRLVDFVSGYFYRQDLRSFQCKFLIGCGFHVKGAEALLHQSALIHMVLSRFSRDPNFVCSQESLMIICEEMKSCVKVLVSARDGLVGAHKSQLLHIGIAIYIGWFLRCYQQISCTSAVYCLQALDTYINTLEFTEIVVKDCSKPPEINIITVWLRFLMTNKLLKILEKFRSKEVDIWLENSLKMFNLIESSDNTVESVLAPGRGLKKRPLMTLSKLKIRLKSMIRRIILQVNAFVANSDSKLAHNALKVFTRKQSLLPRELAGHFNNDEEFTEFDLYLEGNSLLYRLIQASTQSISNFVFENPTKLIANESAQELYHDSIQENVNLFKNGLEIFKSKEQTLGFAIDRTDKKHLVVLSTGKKDKIREVSIEHSLIFKRFNQDLEVENEDPETYHECIKQFDRLTGNQAYIYNPSITAVLSHLYTHQVDEFEEEMKLPPVNWHRSPLKTLLSSLSSYKSRQEKAEKIATHPMLPLYVTGNEILTLWQFNRYESLQDFTTSSTPSKITSIKFNSYGDKMGVCDSQGFFYLYKFDLQPTSFQPQIIFKSQPHLKSSNFCFLNLGSVVATTGHKPKGFLSVHDTLLPPNRSVYHTENLGGKFIGFVSRYQQLLLTGNNGKIVKFDMRMREIIETFDSKHENITDLKIGPGDVSYFTSGTEGLVKVWDTCGNSVREVIDVCKRSKNKGVSQIECIENSLFASTYDGSVKLLRIIQY